jgi:SpoVK/Ycf46/Vps4 family AAA+-type ATPase
LQPIIQQSPEPFESDLVYLQWEMEWIQARCKRIEAQRELSAVQRGKTSRAHPFSSRPHHGDPKTLQLSLERLQKLESQLRAHVDARLEATRNQGVKLKMDELCERCHLSPFERSVVLLTLAPCFSEEFDAHLSNVVESGCAQQPTIDVVFAFNELSFEQRIKTRERFSSQSPLRTHDIITLDVGRRLSDPRDLLTASLSMTHPAFNYLLGEDSLGDELLEFSSLEEPLAQLDDVVLPAQDKDRILSIVQNHDRYLEVREEWGFDDRIRYGRGILMLFHGPPGTGKTMTAHGVAAEMGKRILNVDIPTFLAHQDANRFLPGLFREARLRDAILFFDECEILLHDRRKGNTIMTMLLTELERFEGVAILATNLPDFLDSALNRRILVKIRFNAPDREARLDIWNHHLPPQACIADDVDTSSLATRFELSGGYIKNAVLAGLAQAVHEDQQSPMIRMQHLEQAAQDQLQRPTSLVPQMTVPKVRLADVILPDELESQVAELLDMARHSKLVRDRWQIGDHLTYGHGISALMYGGPGTGKTLCAEAIASELNRPLVRAQVPAIVSKYVGSTERNLSKFFSLAKSESAVLFFDEADSLLMERGMGRASRHDDSVVNVLLQLIEQHDGVTLLATNLPECIDRALARRITFHLDFPFPDAAARERIWSRLLDGNAPLANDIDCAALARDFVLAGGHIKNAVLKAAYRAYIQEHPIRQCDLIEAAVGQTQQAGTTTPPIVGFGR